MIQTLAPKNAAKFYFDMYFHIFNIQIKDSELGTYLPTCASKFRFRWSNFRFKTPEWRRVMIQTLAQKSRWIGVALDRRRIGQASRGIGVANMGPFWTI